MAAGPLGNRAFAYLATHNVDQIEGTTCLAAASERPLTCRRSGFGVAGAADAGGTATVRQVREISDAGDACE
jgi:hypothetical protein